MKIDFMLCEEADEKILDSRNHLFQKKFDGERALLFSDANGVRLLNRRGRFTESEFPELKDIRIPVCVLDGEIMVPANEKYKDKPSTAGRTNRTNSKEIELLSQLNPAVFVAFDLLSLDGKNLRGKPLEARLELLDKLKFHSPSLKVAPVYEDGRALWAEVKVANGEGIVAKRKGSIYEGRRSFAWLKIKRWQSGRFDIIGFSSHKRSLSAFLLEGGKKVNCSLPEETYDKVLAEIEKEPILTSKIRDGQLEKYFEDKHRWDCEIKFLSETPDGLRFPILQTISKDKVCLIKR